MYNIKAKDLIIYGGSICLAVIIFLFLLTTNLIGYGVKDGCQLAKDKYPGSCVEALIAYLDDDSNDMRSRNTAIWALGQLGDKQALPALNERYVGVPEGKEPLSKTISQYELKKAINLLGDGFNVSAPFWRFGPGVK
ncbi:HEAT repeat domain-containing protein [Patescibacteria group bacterium]|nr:HEAT repeat domain-containing protein [Patescibacteria group bacterium]MBU1890607.1 HEAT repeat domain-containing protein [Patescibacteria group bacterium]